MKNTIIYRILRKIYHIIKHKKISYKPLNKNKFIKKLLKYDVISFDIFDTLITRKIYDPDDLFKLMGKKLEIEDFLEKRKKAEQKARQELKKDVNLDEIYNYYQKLYSTDSQKIQKLEEELELDFCIPRKDMLEVFKELIENDKYIILTSDMYLKKDTITKMLKKCGFSGYKDFYVSNDLNLRKDTKTIWPFLLEKYNNKKIIHIGDNYNSDYLYPKEFEIDTIKIENGKQLFSRLEINNYIQEFISSNIDNSILVGLIMNKGMFNSPFQKLELDSIDNFSYVFHGPIINAYLNYISEETKNEDILLFLAREGYYLQQLYEKYCDIYKKKKKESVYFLASRKAATTANMNCLEDIIKTLDNEFHGNISDFFKQIYEIDYKENDFPIVLPADKEKVIPIVNKYEKEILKITNKQKENYLQYISETIKDYKKKKMAIIDLGYSGTIQFQLSKLTNMEYSGYYLTNSKTVKKYSKNSKLNFLFDINQNSDYEKIYHYSLILEYFLSAPYGQLIKFNKDKKTVKPVYNDDVLDENKKKTLEKIYQNVVEYIEDIHEINNIYSIKPSNELLCRIYTCIVEGNIVSRKVKDYFSFTDYFCNNETRNVFKIISRY